MASVLISGIHVSPTQHDLVYLIAGLINPHEASKNQKTVPTNLKNTGIGAITVGINLDELEAAE